MSSRVASHVEGIPMIRAFAIASVLLLALIVSAPARAAVNVQEVKSTSGITAWLVRDRLNPIISMRVLVRNGGAVLDQEAVPAFEAPVRRHDDLWHTCRDRCGGLGGGRSPDEDGGAADPGLGILTLLRALSAQTVACRPGAHQLVDAGAAGRQEEKREVLGVGQRELEEQGVDVPRAHPGEASSGPKRTSR